MTPDDLVEIELIKQLKYKYARCLDLKMWDELAETLTEDAVCDYSNGFGSQGVCRPRCQLVSCAAGSCNAAGYCR